MNVKLSLFHVLIATTAVTLHAGQHQANALTATQHLLSAISHLTSQGPITIHQAVYENKPLAVQEFLRQDPDLVKQVDANGNTPLHWAQKRGIARLLLDNRANVNQRNYCGETLLHTTRNEKVARLLIGCGADINAQDISGKTPLHTARTENIALLLLINGANVNQVDYSYNTPLNTAACRDVANLIRQWQKPTLFHRFFNYLPNEWRVPSAWRVLTAAQRLVTNRRVQVIAAASVACLAAFGTWLWAHR